MLCFICQVTAPLGTAPTSQVAMGNSLPHSGYMTLTGLRSVSLMNILLLGSPPREEILISTPALQVAKTTRPDPCPTSLDPRPTRAWASCHPWGAFQKPALG